MFHTVTFSCNLGMQSELPSATLMTKKIWCPRFTDSCLCICGLCAYRYVQSTRFWSGGTVTWCFLTQWSWIISCSPLWRLSERSQWRLWLCSFCSAWNKASVKCSQIHKNLANSRHQEEMFRLCDCNTNWLPVEVGLPYLLCNYINNYYKFSKTYIAVWSWIAAKH